MICKMTLYSICPYFLRFYTIFMFFFSCFSPMLYSPTFNIKYLIPKVSVPGASIIIIFPFWTFHSCILFSEHNNASCCWIISALRFSSSSKIQKKLFYSEIINFSPSIFSGFTNSHICQIVSREFAQMLSLFKSIHSNYLKCFVIFCVCLLVCRVCI